MKILIVHNEYIHRGGEDVAVENEIQALEEAGISVRVFKVRSRPGMAALKQAASSPWGKSDAAWRSLLREDRPDILHVHNLFPLLSPRLFQVAAQEGVPSVQTLHNYRPLCLNGLFLTPAQDVCERCSGGNYLHGIARGCYRKSRPQSAALAAHLWTARFQNWYGKVARFIAPCEFLRDKFIRGGFDSARFVVQGHFLPTQPSTRPEIPDPYVLYLGRLSSEKGIGWLLNTFKHPELPLKLVIAGQGPMEEEVRRAVNATIEYVGHVDGIRKDDLLRKATALLLPSECYENFPLTVMEANAWGTPVLASHLGGLAEIIRTNQNGATYALRDPRSFWDALRRLSTPSGQEDLRRTCQDHAKSQFSKSQFLNVRRSIYDDVLRETRPAKRV